MQNTRPFLYTHKELIGMQNAFIQELTGGIKRKRTSLLCVDNVLPNKSLVGENEIFQVFSVGATIFEKADAIKKGDKLFFMNIQKCPLPILKDKNTIFAFFNKYIRKNTRIISLSFAQALSPFQRGGVIDGVLLRRTKEHAFAGLLGKAVGEEIEKYLFKVNNQQLRIAVVNDTIPIVLSELKDYSWRFLVGGILGSGTNFCFFRDKNTVVNLESGNFNKLILTDTGKQIDKDSLEPGKQLFEKEVAGVYLYKHYNLFIKTHGINTPLLTSTYDLSTVASSYGSVASIARVLFERSASLIACQLAGIFTYKKMQRIIVAMEGSLFWKGWCYKELVEKYLKIFGVPEKGIYFTRKKNAMLVGAASLVAW